MQVTGMWYSHIWQLVDVTGNSRFAMLAKGTRLQQVVDVVGREGAGDGAKCLLGDKADKSPLEQMRLKGNPPSMACGAERAKIIGQSTKDKKWI